MSAPGPVAGTASTGKLRELVDEVLDLERIERDIFRGRSPRESLLRVFGGQVAGQAMVAAGRTVDDDRTVHSLHGYFLRPGDPFAPIVYEVDRTRDGRSFTTRRVTAVQHGETIFTMSASFQRPEEGVEHQVPMPGTPGPEHFGGRDLPGDADRPARTTTGQALTWPLDIRPVDTPDDGVPQDGTPEDGTPTTTGRDGCGSGPTGSSPTRTAPAGGCCTPACSPTPRTSHCSRPRSSRTCPRGRGPRRSPSRASTTPCGSTGRSGPTSGCSTCRSHRARAAGAAWPAAACTAPTAC